MATRWNRLETWLTLLLAGVGAVLMFVAGLWIFMSATATPLHPTAQSVQSVPQSGAQQQFAGAIDRAREIVRAAVAEQNLPGLSIAVGAGANIVWSEGFGWTDIESKAPVTPATRFRLGTGSVPLTAAAAGVLLDRNQLRLDEKIQTYVPEFPDKKWPVTLRQVMAHTAGLPTDEGDESPLLGQHCDRAADALPFFTKRDLRFEPGTQFYYSRLGYIPVSAAIEHVTGDTLARFMRKEIFEPLGMNDTMPDPSAEPASPDRSTSYFPRFAADPRYGPDLNRPLDFSCYSGAGMFVSTSGDLVRFVLALNNGKVLKPETVQLLQTQQRLPSGEGTSYGLGWDVDTVTFAGKPTVVVGHDGEILGGIASTLMVFRDPSLIVAVLANTSYADTPGLAVKIAEAFAPR